MQITKSYGTDGEVVVSLGVDDPKDFDLQEPLFINFDELPVPFFIERLEMKGNRMIVKFEDIDSYDLAEEIIGKEVFFENDGSDEDSDEFIGLDVIDQKGVRIGQITDFHNFNGNTCISVDCDGKEILLPINDELILNVTDEAIVLTVPKGLI